MLGASFQATALLLGERINTRHLAAASQVASTPLMLPCGRSGHVVLLRFGVVVFFAVSASEQDRFLVEVGPEVVGGYPAPLRETLGIRVDPDASDGFAGDYAVMPAPTPERLQLVADVLAKSLVLELYEDKLTGSFDQIEPLAQRLRKRWRRAWRPHDLTDQIGQALLTEQRMVGRVEIKDKPEILWDHPELEGFYLRMFDEFELGERGAALENKLGLITRTAETLLRLEEARRSLRAEWYIIILIVVEILLTLYELFLHA